MKFHRRPRPSKPTFSVLMAARNAEDTIRLAVRSTLLALGSQDELLVFLDGCDDKTESVLRAIDDPRLKVHHSETSVGRSAARNALSIHALGTHFAIMDADDVSLPWRFLISRNRLRKYDAVFGAAWLFGELPFRLPFATTYPVRVTPELAPIILTYRNPFVHSSAAFKRETVTVGSLYSNILTEEYLLWIEMASAGHRLFRSRLPLAAYRIHAGQVTRSRNFLKDALSSSELKAAQQALAKKQIRLHAEFVHSADNSGATLQRLAQSLSLGIKFEESFLARVLGLLSRVFSKTAQ